MKKEELVLVQEEINELAKKIDSKQTFLKEKLEENLFFIKDGVITKDKETYCIEIKKHILGEYIGYPHDQNEHYITHIIREISFVKAEMYIKALQEIIAIDGRDYDNCDDDYDNSYDDAIFKCLKKYFKGEDYTFYKELFENDVNDFFIFLKLNELRIDTDKNDNKTYTIRRKYESTCDVGSVLDDSYIKIYKTTKSKVESFKCDEQLYADFL